MTSQEIELKVREIISAKFAVPLEAIGADTKLVDDLKVDSFGAVELLFELEEAFGLKIPDADIEHVRSVNQIVNYLQEWLQKKADAELSATASAKAKVPTDGTVENT